MTWLGQIGMGAILALGVDPGKARVAAVFGPQEQISELWADGHLLLTDAGFYLARPGWQGGVDQKDAKDVTTEWEKDLRVHTGRLASGEMEAVFTEKVKLWPDRIDIELEISPCRSFAVERVLYRFFVPVESGESGRWCLGTRTGLFPPTTSDSHALAGDVASQMGWGKEENGVLVRSTMPLSCQVQDDRKFGIPCFEFQFCLTGAGEMRAGEPVQVGFSIASASPADLARPLLTPGTPRSFGDHRAMKLSLSVPADLRVPRYERIEWALDLQASYGNPFDPDEIDVQAEVTSPTGSRFSVPAFFWMDYTRELKVNQEILTPEGKPGWRVRLCPQEIGTYQVQLSAQSRTGSVTAGPVRFECVPSQDHGFVRVSPDDPRYFAFDDGTPYLAIGANVCWAGSRGSFDYDDWLSRYGQAGCNYFRVWLAPSWTTLAIERAGTLQEGLGCGNVDLANAWRLDHVLDLAEEQGLYVMLCFDSFNELRMAKDGCYPHWESTPQNAANGGPIAHPKEFWTHEAMKRLYRNKMRYLVARYGASTHVLSWEFWNEVDIVSPSAYVPEEVRDWHAEMADHLRRMDPWQHLISTSFADSNGKPEIDSLPQMDYVQTHNYGSRDIAEALVRWQRSKARYGKPHYVGEFGTDAAGGDERTDPSGIALHNGLWAPVMSGAAGTGMLWYWDGHIHPNDLYRHYQAFSNFVAGIDWPRASFKDLDSPRLEYQNPLSEPIYVDRAFNSLPVRWEDCPSNRPVTVIVARDGTGTNLDRLSGILHGVGNHPAWHNPARFELDLARGTDFVVQVTGVSGYGGAHLKVSLDGKPALDVDMPDTNPPGQHDTLNQYNQDLEIPVPAGPHSVLVENVGQDWVFVEYALKAGVERTTPFLRVWGLQNERMALAWVQHEENTWYCAAVEKKTPREVPPSVLILSGLGPGSYLAEVWNTYQGAVVETQEVTSTGGEIRIMLPAISTDLAVKVK